MYLINIIYNFMGIVAYASFILSDLKYIYCKT